MEVSTATKGHRTKKCCGKTPRSGAFKVRWKNVDGKESLNKTVAQHIRYSLQKCKRKKKILASEVEMKIAIYKSI